MADTPGDHPSDEELMAFAAGLLGGRNSNLTEPELLRETVAEARELWVLLYRVNRDYQARK